MSDTTITLLLRLIHILAGVFWAGAMFMMAGFLLPTVSDTGEAGGRFIQHLVQRRRLPIFLGIAMGLTVLSGLAMYARLTAATHGAWAGSRPGMAYGVGGLAAILGAAVGAIIGSSAGRRLAAIGQSASQAGKPPSVEQQAEIQRLQGRMRFAARTAAGLLAIAVAAMAVARYL